MVPSRYKTLSAFQANVLCKQTGHAGSLGKCLARLTGDVYIT